MIDYCPKNSTLYGIGFSNINRCFLDTITDPFLLFVCLVFGLHQLRLYKRYSTPIDSENIPKSCMFHFQIVLHLLIPILALLRFFLLLYGYNEEIVGVEILNLICAGVAWPLVGWLAGLERRAQLPVSARNGHGPVLLIFWSLAFMQVNLQLASITHELWWDTLDTHNYISILHCAHYITVYTFTSLVFILGIKAPGLSQPDQYLRMTGGCPVGGGGGGLLPQEAQNRSPWTDITKKVKRLMPFMWPGKSRILQLRVVFCLILLAGVRVTNLFVPILYKDIVDALVETELRPSTWPWQYVTIWAVLRLLQGGGTGSSGLLNNWRSLLWIRVQQYTTLEIQTNLLAHVHNLSLRWHLGRKTGELTRIMDRGTSAVNNLLQYLIFNILPTLIDIIIAVIYFCLQFNVYFGLIVLITMVLYLLFTFAITEWRTKFRREMNELDNKQRARGVDSLLNAETVKYYSMEEYEVLRYKELIQDCQAMEWKSMATLQFLNLIQSLIINNGLFGVSLYCAYLVTNKELTVGDFTLVGTYFMQLMSPLNFIGTVYRMIQESFINMENMFDLLDEKIEIQDKPDAITYKQNNHPPELQFQDVSFHYTECRPILENLSFVIPPGSSVAVVGASGNGKSTLAKILFRLFDPVKGAVLINGRDIRDYTQKSYRGNIGVVPQDTVLFNESIMYNLSYGKIGVTQAEIENAAKMADIHDTILDFPDGYKTVVGERGLKLSGGEKQRVAIARALIKNPNIIIFDEATSSLDTKTELHIQNAIESASKQRTVLMIAHRLSTVMNCDQILVLDEGRIAERGTHDELLQLDGKYANLWNIQIAAVNSKESHTEENKPGDEGGTVSTQRVCNGAASKMHVNPDANVQQSNNVLANATENSHVENTENELDINKQCISTDKINERDDITETNETIEKDEEIATVTTNENIDDTITEDHDEISEDTKLLSSSPKVCVTKSTK